MDENNFTLFIFLCHIILYFKYISTFVSLVCFSFVLNDLFGNISYNNIFLDSYSNTMVFILGLIHFDGCLLLLSDFLYGILMLFVHFIRCMFVYWMFLNMFCFFFIIVNLIYWLLFKVGSVVRAKCVKTSPCVCVAKWTI